MTNIEDRYIATKVANWERIEKSQRKELVEKARYLACTQNPNLTRQLVKFLVAIFLASFLVFGILANYFFYGNYVLSALFTSLVVLVTLTSYRAFFLSKIAPFLSQLVSSQNAEN